MAEIEIQCFAIFFLTLCSTQEINVKFHVVVVYILCFAHSYHCAPLVTENVFQGHRGVEELNLKLYFWDLKWYFSVRSCVIKVKYFVCIKCRWPR